MNRDGTIGGERENEDCLVFTVRYVQSLKSFEKGKQHKVLPDFYLV